MDKLYRTVESRLVGTSSRCLQAAMLPRRAIVRLLAHVVRRALYPASKPELEEQHGYYGWLHR